MRASFCFTLLRTMVGRLSYLELSRTIAVDAEAFRHLHVFRFWSFPERLPWMWKHFDVCVSFGFGAFPNDCHDFDVCVSFGFGAFPDDGHGCGSILMFSISALVSVITMEL
jgi:hypothetical protein